MVGPAGPAKKDNRVDHPGGFCIDFHSGAVQRFLNRPGAPIEGVSLPPIRMQVAYGNEEAGSRFF
jgi:hypothetical protein